MGTVDYTERDHQQLVAALVARQPHAQALLARSSSFRHSIDELARMLPAMIAGLARYSEGVDRMLAERVEVAKRLAPSPVVVLDGFGPVPTTGSTTSEHAAAQVCEGSYQTMAWGIDEGSVECPECGMTMFPEGDEPTVPSHPPA